MAPRLAHDIKNPLNVIAGAVHNLRATCSAGEMAEMLSLIAEQSQRLADLVDRLRELTRPLTPKLETVDAAQAAGHHGSVRVAAWLDTRPEGEWLVIEVEDDGPGLPPQVLDHLFEPFVSTRPDGVGLGLVIMREICELHGGTLAVDNVPAGGARLTARLLSR